MIRTTMDTIDRHRAYVPMPYLHPHELDQALAAVAAGELVPIMAHSGTGGIASGTIAAFATIEASEALTARDDNAETVEELLYELRLARKELDSLTTINGEVHAESEPTDHFYKLEDAAADVRSALDASIDYAERL